MGVLEDILSARQLSDFQSVIACEGRRCPSCGAEALVTPPVSGAPDMARIFCPVCKTAGYEILESDVEPAEGRSPNVIPFRSPEER